jgi:hypothetical protein
LGLGESLRRSPLFFAAVSTARVCRRKGDTRALLLVLYRCASKVVNAIDARAIDFAGRARGRERKKETLGAVTFRLPLDPNLL